MRCGARRLADRVSRHRAPRPAAPPVSRRVRRARRRFRLRKAMSISSTVTSTNPAPFARLSSSAGSPSEKMPPGPMGGPPLTSPFSMAAMPTHVIHGLCSMPAHVSTPTRPPARSTRWISANATAGSGVNISPMRQATTSKELVRSVDGRGVDHGGLDVVERRVAAAGDLDHARRDVAQHDRAGRAPRAPTTTRPRLPGPAASSSTASPGRGDTRSSKAVVAAIECSSTSSTWPSHAVATALQSWPGITEVRHDGS